MKRLAVSDETKTSSEQEMDKHRERVNQLKEVLQTTSRCVCVVLFRCINICSVWVGCTLL